MKHPFWALALLATFAVTLAVAQPRKPQGPGQGRAVEVLNLTDAQEKDFEQLRLDLMKKQTDLHAKVRSLRLDIKQQFLADKVDRGAIEKNLKAISGIQEQLKMNKLDHWFRVNSMLNAEQQKTWKKMAQRFQGEGGKDFRQGFRGRGQRGPGQGLGLGPCGGFNDLDD